MTAKQKLIKRLPKKYQERIKDFYEEDDLIDNCKYMLELKDDWVVFGDYSTIPVRTITEALNYIKGSVKNEYR